MNIKPISIDLKLLRNYLEYNPHTGLFFWKVKFNNIKAGQLAGYVRANKYQVISFMRNKFQSHRLAWYMFYEYEPKEIDHINRNPSDNRIKNLRECSHSENMLNRYFPPFRLNPKIGKNSGYYKVIRDKGVVWVSRIRKKGVVLYIGTFNKKQDARKAFVKEWEKIHLNK